MSPIGKLMTEAKIRFEGKAFHWVKWDQLLTNCGFRVAGRKAFYASEGSILRAEDKGFAPPDFNQGYESQLRLEQTRRWEGALKFYSVLLAAFSMPQPATVTVADHQFADRDALRKFAEKALIEEFSIDELIRDGIYRKGEGLQFR
jgi:hypothetical protein